MSSQRQRTRRLEHLKEPEPCVHDWLNSLSMLLSSLRVVKQEEEKHDNTPDESRQIRCLTEVFRMMKTFNTFRSQQMKDSHLTRVKETFSGAEEIKASSSEVENGVELNLEDLPSEFDARVDYKLPVGDAYHEQPTEEPDSIFKTFLLQFHDLLIYMLLFLAVIILLSGEYSIGCSIVAVVLVKVVVDTVNTANNNRLKSMSNSVGPSSSPSTWTVFRQGFMLPSSCSWYTPRAGDVVVLKKGDVVPSEGILLSVDQLSDMAVIPPLLENLWKLFLRDLITSPQKVVDSKNVSGYFTIQQKTISLRPSSFSGYSVVHDTMVYHPPK